MKTLTLKPAPSRGFTLVEVMVALVIIALSLTGMAVTMGGMLNNATTMYERTYASWIAQNKIVEIRADGAAPEIGTTSGDVEFANGDWAWRAVVSETGIENLLRIDVSVSRPGSEVDIRSVTGFVGEPEVPGVANALWSAGKAASPGPGEFRDPGGPTE